MENFSALQAICAGIHRSSVNFPHKSPWRRALMFSLPCDWINGWVNNRDDGDLRRHRAHYDVIVMVHTVRALSCIVTICYSTILILTHWGRVTLICVSKITIISSNNDLSPERRQAIIWINAGALLMGSLGTNFGETLTEIYTFSITKMPLKMSSAKWRPFCIGLNVVTHRGQAKWMILCMHFLEWKLLYFN